MQLLTSAHHLVYSYSRRRMSLIAVTIIFIIVILLCFEYEKNPNNNNYVKITRLHLADVFMSLNTIKEILTVPILLT